LPGNRFFRGRRKHPCPAGFRLPTDTEWEAEWVSWSSSNSAGAFGSPLKLVAAGCRGSGNGSLSLVDGYGFYWSSTVLGSYALGLNFGSGLADAGGYTRVLGFSVRCLKD